METIDNVAILFCFLCLEAISHAVDFFTLHGCHFLFPLRFQCCFDHMVPNCDTFCQSETLLCKTPNRYMAENICEGDFFFFFFFMLRYLQIIIVCFKNSILTLCTEESNFDSMGHNLYVLYKYVIIIFV